MQSWKFLLCICLRACLDWHLYCCMCDGDSATVHILRLQDMKFRLVVFAPSMFLTGLRVFSVGIVINLLCADKSGRAGNIKIYRKKSPWIIWNPVWIFHYIAAQRLSRSCSHFSVSVSLVLLFWCFPLPFLSLFLFLFLAVTSFSLVCLSLSLASPLFGASWEIGRVPPNWHTDE